jgi:hypothetical protein
MHILADIKKVMKMYKLSHIDKHSTRGYVTHLVIHDTISDA